MGGLSNFVYRKWKQVEVIGAVTLRQHPNQLKSPAYLGFCHVSNFPDILIS